MTREELKEHCQEASALAVEVIEGKDALLNKLLLSGEQNATKTPS